MSDYFKKYIYLNTTSSFRLEENIHALDEIDKKGHTEIIKKKTIRTTSFETEAPTGVLKENVKTTICLINKVHY